MKEKAGLKKGLTRMIEIKNLGKSFDGVAVLDNINCSIEEGSFTSLIGPSGCGKSTLINIIAGLDQATSGGVWVQGKKVNDTHTDRVMVFQNAALFPWLTVYENIAFGLRNTSVKAEEIRHKVEDVLRKVHLSRFRDYFPYQLSGGMKQRVSIARSLVMNPRILLMDEPFSALDEQTRMLLHSELQQIWMETRQTIIFVTHNLREAVKLSNRVIVMGIRPGTIVDDVPIQAGFPRNVEDPQIFTYEKNVFKRLKAEIEKVAKEEMGSDYHFKEGHIPWDSSHTLGSGI